MDLLEKTCPYSNRRLAREQLWMITCVRPGVVSNLKEAFISPYGSLRI